MSTFKQVSLLLMVIFYAQLVKANNGEKDEKKSLEVSVHGSVKDAKTRKPVTGVTVSASRNMQNGGKEIQSDAAGFFKFAKLPPGNITLTFKKEGYKLFKHDLLAVKEGFSTKLKVDIQPIEDQGNEMWHPLLKLLD